MWGRLKKCSNNVCFGRLGVEGRGERREGHPNQQIHYFFILWRVERVEEGERGGWGTLINKSTIFSFFGGSRESRKEREGERHTLLNKSTIYSFVGKVGVEGRRERV